MKASSAKVRRPIRAAMKKPAQAFAGKRILWWCQGDEDGTPCCFSHKKHRGRARAWKNGQCGWCQPTLMQESLSTASGRAIMVQMLRGFRSIGAHDVLELAMNKIPKEDQARMRMLSKSAAKRKTAVSEEQECQGDEAGRECCFSYKERGKKARAWKGGRCSWCDSALMRLSCSNKIGRAVLSSMLKGFRKIGAESVLQLAISKIPRKYRAQIPNARIRKRGTRTLTSSDHHDSTTSSTSSSSDSERSLEKMPVSKNPKDAGETKSSCYSILTETSDSHCKRLLKLKSIISDGVKKDGETKFNASPSK